MKRTPLSFWVLCLILFNQVPVFGIVLNEGIILQRIGFETRQDLSGWAASGSEFSVSSRHYKEGSSSLRWRWSNSKPLLLGPDVLPGLTGAADFYPGGIPETYEVSYIPKSRQGGLKLWVYRESPHPGGKLIFKVGADKASVNGNPKYRFEMKQDFTGWRALWVHFEEDARVAGYEGSDVMTVMQIQPSANMPEGEVYLDLFQLVSFVSRKRHSDEQFANDKFKGRKDSYIILPPWERYRGFQSDAEVTEATINDFQTIEKRLEFLILGSGAPSPLKANLEDRLESELERALKTFNNLDIKKHDGAINGQPLFSSRDEQPAAEGANFQKVGQDTFFALALDYRQHPDESKLDRLMNLFDHFSDQGWAAGSAVGTTDHIIRVNPIATSVFLMRHELAATGRLAGQRDALLWHTRIGELLSLDRSKGYNTDHVRGGALAKVIGILLLPDTPEKLELLLKFVEFVEHNADFAPGYSDTVKPDGSIFHHRGAYQNSYGVQSLTVMAMLHWLLSDTKFALSDKGSDRLKDTLFKQFDFAADFELHPGYCGRFPYNNSGLDRFMAPAYAFLSFDGGCITDEETAAAFAYIYEGMQRSMLLRMAFPGLTYAGTYGSLELMEQVFQAGQSNNFAPREGFFTFPYAAGANHKASDWVASVRGFSQYVWDFETSPSYENPFGRYFSFGALLLFTEGDPLSLHDSGILLNDGFHFAYMPGATTKALPMSEILYDVIPTSRYLEGKHRNFTRNTFVGGVAHMEDQGMFAMEFHDTVAPDERKALFDDSFGFRKSFFFFGNEIICLGSDIANTDERFETITTLFQQQIPAETASPESRIIDGGYLKDASGNYYILPEGESAELETGMQTSMKVTGNRQLGPVEAYTTKAWISHGKAPSDGSYAYQIIVKPDADTAWERCRNANYRVLQKDGSAHIVELLDRATTGYALFEAGVVDAGALDYISEPVMVMLTEEENHLNLSIADPDLRLAEWNHNMSFMPGEITHAAAGQSFVTVRLKGNFLLEEKHPDVTAIYHYDGKTEFNIRLDHGITRALNLVRQQATY